MEMLAVRSRNRLMVTRPSARASGAPAHVWIPCPKAMCCRAFGAVDVELVGMVEHPGVPVAGAGDEHERRPGGDVDAAELGGDAGHPELGSQRALEPEGLLNEVGDLLAVRPHGLLEVGSLAQHAQRERQQPHGGLLAAGEEVGGDQGGVLGLGSRAVREGRGGQAGEDVVSGRVAAILDVLVEALVEEFQGLVADVLVRGREPLPEEGVVGLGHALQVGDDREREGLGVRADHLERALLEEPIDEAVGELPHEVLVLLEALRRDEPHQQVPVCRVVRRVERGELVAERQLVAVLHDDVADVVALHRDGELDERPADHVARRVGPGRQVVLGERGGVAVDRHRLGVAGDHVHAEVRLPPHRPLLPHPVEVGVRIVLDRRDP